MEPLAKDAFTLDPAITFLNHGSYGACPRAVLEHQAELRARLEREPVYFFERLYEPLLDESRAALASLVGAAPEGLVFVRNATAGVNTVLRSLPLGPGDRVLTTDHAYPAVARALDVTAARTGATIDVVEVPFPVDDRADGGLSARVVAALRPTTRLVVVDHVTSPTGLVLPIEPLIAELGRRGVEVLVDGAHAPGMLPLALDRLGADYYTGNAHKWLCAPKGSAFLYVSRSRRAAIHPLSTSYLEPHRLGMGQEFDWTGTDDPTPILSIPAALRAIAAFSPGGVPALAARNRALALAGRELLLAALGAPAPCPASWIGSLAAVPLPADLAGPSLESRTALHRALFDEDRIEVPIFAHGGRAILRISAQAYNGLDDVHRLVAALERRRR